MIVVELQAAIDAAGTVSTFYLSTERFTTSPTDTPANISFDNRLNDAGSIGINAFSNGRTGGSTKLEVGEIKIVNPDGELDVWANYSFDGRPIVIRSGEPTAAYPSGFSTVLSGTSDGIELSWDTVIVRLKDKQFYFDKPVLSTVFVGNNSLPNGLEGTASDVGGKLKPRTIGKVFNVSPPLVNTSKLTYQVNQGAVNDISAVYDRGLALTKGADYATSALLQAAAPAASTYITCFAEGYFRLGSSPAGQVTADVIQGASSANRTVAQILKQLALDSGLSSGEISSSDVTALDSANSNTVGIWLNDEESSFSSVMDEIAGSIGAWYGFDSLGVLRMGRLLTPSGTPVITLQDYQIQDNIERNTPKDTSIPTYRVNVDHTKIYTIQTSDLAGAVSDATRALLATEYRTVKSEDLSILTQWKQSTPISYQTLLTSSSDASTEAARLLALYKVRRDVFSIPINLQDFSTGNSGNALQILDVVRVILPRFGMDSGRDFRLIGYNIDMQQETCILTLWG